MGMKYVPSVKDQKATNRFHQNQKAAAPKKPIDSLRAPKRKKK